MNKQPVTDRVLVGEETPGQRFIDDCDFRRPDVILRVEWSPGRRLNTHCPKVVGADVIYCDRFSHLERRPTFDEAPVIKTDSNAEDRLREWKGTGQACGLYAMQFLDAREPIMKISAALWRRHRVFEGAGHER